MSDLQNTITTKLGNTPAAMDLIAGKLRAIGAETAKAVRQARDLQIALSKSLGRAVSAGAAEAGKSIQQFGQAMQKIGGPGGGILGQILGGAGMSPGFARLAAAMGVAALAGKAFSAVANRMGEDARKAAQGQLELVEALRKAKEASEKTAEAGVAHADPRRQLLAAGGQEAVDMAREATRRGVAPQDADRGVAGIYGRYGPGPKARAAVNVAIAATGVGVPFAVAADSVAESGADLTTGAAARASRARIFRDHFKRRGPLQLDEAMTAVGNDPLVARQGQANRLAGEQRDAEVDKAISIGPDGAGRRRLSGTVSPESAAQLEAYRKNTEAIELLRRTFENLSAKSQDPNLNQFGRAAAAFEAMWARMALLREQRVQGESTFGPGG